MLNYVWLFLISFGIFVGLYTDITDQVFNTYKNNSAITLNTRIDQKNKKITFKISKEQLIKHYGITSNDIEFCGTLLGQKNETIQANFIINDNYPKFFRNIAKSSGNENDIDAKIKIIKQNDSVNTISSLELEKVSFLKTKEITNSALKSAETAVEIAIGLIGVMAFWLGLMKIAEQAGLIKTIANSVRPITKFLFPEVPADNPAIGAIVMNMSANMLGLGNAATPFGLKAMDELNKINPNKGTASNAMCTFLAINTAGFTLIPATSIAVRSAVGSMNPALIIGTTMFSAICSTTIGILSVKTLEKFSIPNFNFAAWVKQNIITIFSVVGLVGLISFLASSGIFKNVFHGNSAETFKSVIEFISIIAIPIIILGFVATGFVKKVKVYETFIEGAKEGFDVAVKIIPYLVGMLVAIAIFRTSGGMEFLVSILQPATNLIGMPAEALPMAIMRPLSGSGSIAIMSEIMKTHGADNMLGVLVSTLYGSSETTFYVLAVYFGSVGISKTRHALAAGLLADLAGVLGATFIVRMLFS